MNGLKRSGNRQQVQENARDKVVITYWWVEHEKYSKIQ